MTLFQPIALIAFGLAGCVSTQFATTTTVNAGNMPLYIPTVGSTSMIASPAATPTLVYNCFQMRLICENVASWAKQGHGTSDGNLNIAQLFHFDPDEGQKDKRRQHTCGCFNHDNCPNKRSSGKKSGTLIPAIALGPAVSIEPAANNIILAGVNPTFNQTSGTNNPRQSLNAVPGRFYGQGIVYSCDGEIPFSHIH